MSIQIPNLHTSNKTRAVAKAATVIVQQRKDAFHAGQFTVNGTLQFNPGTDDYLSGNMTIDVKLTDSAKGTFVVRTVEQLDTTGRAAPTTYATGRCSADVSPKVVGCRYWLMLVDNKGVKDGQAPDVISFLIFDRNGKRVAYGTGPVTRGGDVSIQANGE